MDQEEQKHQKKNSLVDLVISSLSEGTSAETPNKPGAYRDGNFLVVQSGTVLPARCLRCGDSICTSVRQSYRWYPEGFKFLVLFAIIGLIFQFLFFSVFGALLGFVVTCLGLGALGQRYEEAVDVTVSACQAHQNQKKRIRNWATALLLASVVLAAVSGYVSLYLYNDGLATNIFVVSSLLFLGFVVFIFRFVRWKLVPTQRLERDTVTLRGIKESVLGSLGVPIRCPSCSLFVDQGPSCACCGVPLTSTIARPSSSTAAAS